MTKNTYRWLLFLGLILWAPAQASALAPAQASIRFVFTLADWQTELANAGLTATLEDFDTFADGPLPSFSVAGVDFNSPLSTVSGGSLVSDFRVGPDYAGAGTIGGQPLFGIAFSSPGLDVLFGQAFDINGFNLNTGTQTDFFGIVSTVPLRSVQLGATGLAGNPNALMDDFLIAAAPPSAHGA